jgi:hypothetical protein
MTARRPAQQRLRVLAPALSKLRGRLHWAWGVAAGVVMLVGAAWWWQAPTNGAPAAVLTQAVKQGPDPAAIPKIPNIPSPTPAPALAAASAPPGPPLSALGRAERKAQLALWQARLERSQQALESYRAAAQYPHESRPIEEHADQVRPFEPISEERSLRMPGGSVTQGVTLRTTQERVFASGRESSRVTVSLVDAQNRPLPLRVTRAMQREVTPPGRTQSTVDYVSPVNDAGVQGDAAAGDGVFTALMQPAVQGFGNFAGTVRLELSLEHAGQPGFVYFDLVYSPETAGRWLPEVRDALVDGSLVFTLKAQVLTPGRYVVTGRVDDAKGTPIALVQFNGEVGSGTVEFKLPVFGKLVRDKRPDFPLTLRDVDAFLLKPDAFPDRVTLPRRSGAVHVSGTHPISAFSEAPWASEERARYLTELGNDVAEAERKVKQLGP